MRTAKAHTQCPRHKGYGLFHFVGYVEGILMGKKPTYEELEQRVKELENETFDHNQAEEVLRESEKKYKHLCNELEAILDHLPALIFYKDKKGNFIRVNKYVADAHHMQKKELESKSTF